MVLIKFAFEQLQLHRLEICIVPRNTNSRRVVEKLELRCEGVAERYLEIAGTWEDHVRYAITAEEWTTRRRRAVGSAGSRLTAESVARCRADQPSPARRKASALA